MHTEYVKVVSTVCSICLLISACAPGADQDQAAGVQDDATEMVEYLFVQHSESVTLQDGMLTLGGIAPEVLYFSDRPERIVGRESLAEFLDAWDEGENSFAVTPPNAVLSVVRDQQSFDLAVVLKDPALTEGGSLVYAVDVLQGPQSGVGSNAALFIDAWAKRKDRAKGKRGGESELGRPGGLGSGKPGLETELGKPGDPDIDEDRKDDLEKKARSARDGHRRFDRDIPDDLDRRL